MTLSHGLRVKPGARVNLTQLDPGETHGLEKGAEIDAALARNIERIDELQYVMYAERRRALLVVLQGMDASGKDGTIRHVISGFNPQGCHVTPFKAPTPEELAHDFLWRVHRVVPAKGDVAIFSRSHYEDVVTVRVRGLVPARVWKRRYDEINNFEQLLAENEVVIVKVFLEAPWYVVPADKKWFRNLAVSQILVDTLEALDMRFPPPAVDLKNITLK